MSSSGPVRSPEVQELKAFCAAADLGSLGKAARLLSISQPALSKRLKTLEALVGTELLERSSAGVSLTPAGRQLYEEARKLLTQVEMIERLMTGLHGEERTIRLAVSHTTYEQDLTSVLANYEAQQGSRLKLEITATNSSTVQTMLRDGRADIGIAALDPGESIEDLHTDCFITDEVIVAVPPAHNWSSHQKIPLKRFLETPMIMRDPQANTRRIVERVLAEKGLSLKTPLLEVGSAAAARQAALAKNVPALLSKRSITGEQRGLKAKQVEEITFERRFVILTASQDSLPRNARRFLDHLKEWGLKNS
jgi:DNA-binding transcriptional LysR family regulator